MAGARGTLLAARRLRLSGLLQPGVIRFSNTASNDPDGYERLGPRTHFALDIGGAIELFPQSRWNARFDFISTLPSCLALALALKLSTRSGSAPVSDAVSVHDANPHRRTTRSGGGLSGLKLPTP